MNKLLVILSLVCILVSCNRPLRVLEARGEILTVDSTLDAIQDTQYLKVLEPIKNELEATMNVALGYAPKNLEVYVPESPMLNWASDALLAMAKQLYPGQVDISVVNKGGIRCEWGAGDITRRNVYELMPFDNELVVLTMKGEDILDLCKVYIELGGEGVGGMQMKARGGKLVYAKINGENIVADKYYKVATSDYLSQGNDMLLPLREHTELWRSEQKIRDLYMEYIKQVELVEATVDGRMDIK